MTYIFLLNGSGCGCDYTIGCNQTWKIVDSPIPLTEERIQEIMVETCEDYGDERMDSITVIECNSFNHHSVDDVMAETRRIEREEEEAQVKAEELAELARLQEKYS
jgi:hypothetical protein